MHRFGAFTLAALVALFAGCSSGGSGPGERPAPTLSVSPAEWSVPAGGASKQFTATLTGSGDPVAWSVETAGTAAEVGTLSSTGLYTPPTSLVAGRAVVLKATAGALAARATVHVGAGADGVTLSVTPAAGSVVAGTGQTVALHADTNYGGTLLWTHEPRLGSLQGASATDVTYTAPLFVTQDTAVVVTAIAGALSDSATITVHPGALEVTGPATVRAGGPPVEFTLVTAVGASAVAWSVSPPGVGTISGTGAIGTFTPAASVALDTTFQVVATVGQATGSASSTLVPPSAGPVTVAGTVVDWHGFPYAGAKVVVGAQSAASGADGSFSIAGVTPPYDVTVIAEIDKTISVFRGVSNAAPVLTVFPQRVGGVRLTWIYGKVTSGGIGFADAAVFGPGSATRSTSTGDYALQTFWFGAPSATLNHRATAAPLDAVTHYPSEYWYAVRPVSVTEGVTLTGQDLPIAKLTAGRVTGTTGPGAGSDAATAAFDMTAYFADGTFYGFHHRSAASAPVGAFDVVVPVIPDGAFRLAYSAQGTSGGDARASAPVAPGQTGVSLVLPAIPVGTGPANGAAYVRYTTPLTWTATEVGGLNSVSITCTGGYAFAIVGGERSATVPDLTAHGVVLTPDVTQCTWSPGWASYSLEDYVRGPAAVDVLPVVRAGSGPSRAFTF